MTYQAMGVESGVTSLLGRSLPHILDPVREEVFFREYWESAPLVIRRNTHCHFDALLSLQDIDIALTTLDLRYPDVAVANAEMEIARSEFTFGGDKIDVAGLYQLFFHGTTII